MKWTTIGHEVQKSLIARAISGNSLAHCYIFVGPSSVGKTTLALDLAKILSCTGKSSKPCTECYACKLPTETNPDIQVIDQDEEISILRIRQLHRDFSLRSFASGYKIAIIAGAERLTTEAANALLKFLEEPNPKTLIILTATGTGTIPSTVLSRAQKLSFNLTSDKDFRSALKEFDVPEPKMSMLAQLSLGRIGKAKRLLVDDSGLSAAVENYNQLEQLLAGVLYQRLMLTSEIAAMQSPELRTLLEDWLRIIAYDADPNVDPSAWARTATALTEARTSLMHNANKKIILDRLAVELPKMRLPSL